MAVFQSCVDIQTVAPVFYVAMLLCALSCRLAVAGNKKRIVRFESAAKAAVY